MKLKITDTQSELIALDLGSDIIKLLIIDTNKTPYRIEKFATIQLPPGSIVKNEIKTPAVIADLLKTTIRQANISTKTAALAISRSSTIIKNIAVDSRLSPDEIETRAWIEANHQFPDLVGDSYLDFSIVGPSAKGPSQLELILVACRKDVIKPYLELLQLAGLKAKIVDVNSFALERALSIMANTFPECKTIALLNLDFALSTLIVMQDNKLVYAHDEKFDAQRLQNQIREAGQDSVKLQAALKDNLSTHLRHTMHFFFSTRPNIAIEKLFLAGDCVKEVDLTQFIHNETGLETLLANPFVNMEISPDVNQGELKNYAPALVLCTGLALSKIE